jgi:hypothetical protein
MTQDYNRGLVITNFAGKTSTAPEMPDAITPQQKEEKHLEQLAASTLTLPLFRTSVILKIIEI